MAIVKYGPVVSDARGSVGGTTFSRNAAGAIMKQRTTPTYPATAKQQARAALMALLVLRWKDTLTPAERASWATLANITTFPNKLGEQVKPSGFNIFMRANTLLDLTGQALVETAPIDAVAAAPTLTLAHTPTSGVECTAIGNWDNSLTGVVMVQRTHNLRQTINYYKGPWDLLYLQNFTLYDSLPLVMTTSAQLNVDTRSFFRITAVLATGSASFPVYMQQDVGDPV